MSNYQMISGDYQEAGVFALASIMNTYNLGGGRCEGITGEIWLPAKPGSQRLPVLAKRIQSEAKRLGVPRVRLRGRVTDGVTRPLVLLQGEGDPGAVPAAPARPDWDLVMCGYAGLEGMLRCRHRHRQELSQTLPPSFLAAAAAFMPQIFLPPDLGGRLRRAAVPVRAAALGEDGIFGALFRLSEDERIGVRVDLGRIPLRQETVELLEPYRFNPYLAPNTGGLLIAVPDGKIIMDLLADLQLPLEIIGKTTYNRDKIILSNDEKHYLERPVRPEL